jgi:hypothetical protein
MLLPALLPLLEQLLLLLLPMPLLLLLQQVHGCTLLVCAPKVEEQHALVF